ncbi:MAG: choline-sulfatase [SAR324 cluster bacterium]|nr:choline-sulfatase [SAR324 cluster bacterium]
MRQPNILFIMADQMAGPALPMYGHPVVKVPHLERLAHEGVTFRNAYCNNPVCAPSRASMMTGQLASRIGAYDNAADFPSSIPTLAHYLRGLGYKTCLSGKMHFVGPDQLHGFEERVTTDIYPSDFGWTPDWSQTNPPFAPSVMSMRGIVEAGLCKRSLQIDYDDDVAFQASRKLYDFARERDDKPFFLTASFTHPHNPYTITQEYWDRYRHQDIDMPSVPFIPFENRDPWSQRFFQLIRQDEHDITEEMIRTARHAYYSMINYVDDQVGKLLKTLEETGFSENTIVIFTADHGDMMGERGMWFKFNPFEWSTRIPFIVKTPDCAKGRVENKGVSLVDLLPSLLDLATDGHPPELSDRVDGNSTANLLHGEDLSWEDDVMIEFTGEGIHSPCLILRKDNLKYVYCEDDPGMLFNLEADPGELENLCGNPDYSEAEQKMIDIICERWDPKSMKDKIIESQNRRHFVQKVLLQGTPSAWDYQPFQDASKAYVRSSRETNTTATKGLARFPYVEPVPPDHPRK